MHLLEEGKILLYTEILLSAPHSGKKSYSPHIIHKTKGLEESPGGHSGPVVTQLPPISEVGSSNPGHCMGKLVVAYGWSTVYST